MWIGLCGENLGLPNSLTLLELWVSLGELIRAMSFGERRAQGFPTVFPESLRRVGILGLMGGVRPSLSLTLIPTDLMSLSQTSAASSNCPTRVGMSH